MKLDRQKCSKIIRMKSRRICHIKVSKQTSFVNVYDIHCCWCCSFSHSVRLFVKYKLSQPSKWNAVAWVWNLSFFIYFILSRRSYYQYVCVYMYIIISFLTSSSSLFWKICYYCCCCTSFFFYLPSKFYRFYRHATHYVQTKTLSFFSHIAIMYLLLPSYCYVYDYILTWTGNKRESGKERQPTYTYTHCTSCTVHIEIYTHIYICMYIKMSQ